LSDNAYKLQIVCVFLIGNWAGYFHYDLKTSCLLHVFIRGNWFQYL